MRYFFGLACFIFSSFLYGLSVPFNNIYLKPNTSLQASYTIGNHKIIFCFESDLRTMGIITWPYRGVKQSGRLPIFLKTQADIQGSFADNSGTITIKNNQSGALYVNCLFGF